MLTTYVPILLPLFFVTDSHAVQSYCKPDEQIFKFWNCKGTTATFDAKEHRRVRNIWLLEKYILRFKVI